MARAETQLHNRIANSAAKGINALAELEEHRPDDYIVPVSKIQYRVSGTYQPGYTVIDGTDFAWDLRQHAEDQLLSRVGYPKTLFNKLRSNEWDDLNDNFVNQLINRIAEETSVNFLFRNVQGKTSGILSDRYAIHPTYDMVNQFIETALDHEAIVSDFKISETQMWARVILPEVFHAGDDPFVVGAQFRTSDFGKAPSEIAFLIERLVCENGMVGQQQFRKVHLGRTNKMEDDLRYSASTKRAQARAIIGEIEDATAAIMDKDTIKLVAERIKERAIEDHTLTGPKVFQKYKKMFGDELANGIAGLFTGPDVINIPAGQSMWRLGNTLSWMAKNEEDQDKALALEEEGGRLLLAA